jgi:hypothetical protein
MIRQTREREKKKKKKKKERKKEPENAVVPCRVQDHTSLAFFFGEREKVSTWEEKGLSNKVVSRVKC